MAGSSVVAGVLAGCLDDTVGDVEIADERVEGSHTYTFEAEAGNELIVELQLQHGTFGHADLDYEDGTDVFYEQTERGEIELELREPLENSGTYHLDVVSDGWIDARVGLIV
ncbi:hypothetical protein CYV19_00335 [Natronobacterium gregoryi SP2]|uniref:Uncharacterized protein n=1 Tax=Natronobacterium gregoryi (strain ATCC 43098 / DSM 3393 / CCM 3738 / CIP 104747 / IAM 13177 / JCM 8860 / NBRC 102187 / NCIMB 2189 / SP2) TaxID=797304 RepID=L9XPR5_NATGS|nr:hypothetical protein C490_16139 [Natronobacterium gregoryi SP2]PLK22160.1 hypothetical protein CYV19_00335 [Natronobacterium gregoryi SP2]